ncbi:hypothetical protein RMATCC62417_05552 [Rhizopus microsporus]|nr:hypothetical protein RMATCC62417_05552 [Rhizopus microsporus]
MEEEEHELTRIEKIEHEHKLVQRKNEPEKGGYATLSDYWKEFGHVVQHTMHLKSSSSIQLLLNLTGEFHDVCDAYERDAEIYEYKECFDALDFAWQAVIEDHQPISQTDKVRILNVLRDGQDRASLFGLNQVYHHATEMLDGD